MNEVNTSLYMKNMNKCYIIVYLITYLYINDVLTLRNNEYTIKFTKKILTIKISVHLSKNKGVGINLL
jgi:hypothetical protein